ncbi:MAG TPA: Smr/MutS family protein [Flavipsychrobacter sp.]|nr:Smr/MutS family protein [Flavipsychrobacter sp.]
MKFSIGDKILLKQTDEEGMVTNIISADMYEVEVNGTIFPVHKDDIDHPYLKWFTQKKKTTTPSTLPEQLPLEKKSLKTQRLTQGIYLSFLPVYKQDIFEEVVDYFKIYLINEMACSIQLDYKVALLNTTIFQHKAKLTSFADLYLHNISLEEMNDQPRFHWKFSDAADFSLKEETGVLKIKPQKLFEQLQDLQQKNVPTFQYLLVSDFIIKPKEHATTKIKHSPLPAIQLKSTKGYQPDELPRTELDLHIEQLTSDIKNLTNTDIVNIQLHTLNRYLSLAVFHKLPRMVIIHGLGKGKLKEEVHKILKQIPEVKRFSNEWMGKYGFGATEVVFEY